jgi:hypothetical protein
MPLIPHLVEKEGLNDALFQLTLQKQPFWKAVKETGLSERLGSFPCSNIKQGLEFILMCWGGLFSDMNSLGQDWEPSRGPAVLCFVFCLSLSLPRSCTPTRLLLSVYGIKNCLLNRCDSLFYQ